MNHKSGIDSINAVENNCAVNNVKYGSLHVWPLIRLLLWTQLMHPEKDFSSHCTGVVSLNEYSTSEIFLKGISRLSYLNSIFFFSLPKENQDIINDKYYNRFIDPFIERFFPENKFFKFEIASCEYQNTIPRAHDGFQIPIITKRSSQSHAPLTGFKDVYFYMKNALGIDLDYKLVIERIDAVVSYSIFFEKIFAAVRPKAVFMVCYYHVIAMGMILAARRLGIPTVDYQHGKQGKYHGMYTHWTAAPPSGYDTLPDWFWAWGEETKYNIERFQPNELIRHKALVGGNLWLEAWKSEYITEEPSTASQIDELISGRKAILLSMQPFPDPIPDFLKEVILNSPSDWFWMIRAHPLYKAEARQVVDSLFSGKIDNFDFEISTSAPLFSILKRCAHHVTGFSSVCYEALYFNVGTTLFHYSSLSLYDSYISRNIFTYADNYENLMRSISFGINNSTNNESNPYIVTDLKYAKNALEVILR